MSPDASSGKPEEVKPKKDTDEDDDDAADDATDKEEGLETSLEALLARKERRRVTTDEDADEDDGADDTDPATGESLSVRVIPPQPGEFTCRKCFLVKNKSQLSETKKLLCKDCA